MLSLTGAVLAASMVMGQAQQMGNLMQQYGDLFVGRWIGDVTLISDWPGIGKKGEKVVNHLAVRWIADRKGLEDESFGGNGTGKSIYFWDPASKKIKQYGVDSGGTFWEYECWKEDNKWVWKGGGRLADGTEYKGKGETVFSDGGNTFTLTGTFTMGGEKTLALHDVYKRASK